MSEELERYLSSTIVYFPNLENDLRERSAGEMEVASLGTRMCVEDEELQKRKGEESERYLSSTIVRFPNLQRDLGESSAWETEVASLSTRMCIEDEELPKRRAEGFWERVERSQMRTEGHHKMTEQNEKAMFPGHPSTTDYEQLYKRRLERPQKFFEEFDTSSERAEEKCCLGMPTEVRTRRDENETLLHEIRELKNLPEEQRRVLALKDRILSNHSSLWQTEHFRL